MIELECTKRKERGLLKQFKEQRQRSNLIYSIFTLEKNDRPLHLSRALRRNLVGSHLFRN